MVFIRLKHFISPLNVFTVIQPASTTAFNAMLFLIRNALENIAQAVIALTNRQLPYLINYYL